MVERWCGRPGNYVCIIIIYKRSHINKRKGKLDIGKLIDKIMIWQGIVWIQEKKKQYAHMVTHMYVYIYPHIYIHMIPGQLLSCKGDARGR